MDLEPQQLAADDSEVGGMGPRLSPQARLRRLAISGAAVLLALLVVVAGLPAFRQDALALLSAPTPTPPQRSTETVPTFLTTQIGVFAPAPAHAGDAVTVVVPRQAAYDAPRTPRPYRG